MRRKSYFVFISLFICLIYKSYGQGTLPIPPQSPSSTDQIGSGVSVYFIPSVELAFGSKVNFISLLGSGRLAAEYRFPFLPFLGVSAEGAYSYLPITSQVNLNIFSTGARLFGSLPFSSNILATIALGGGYYYGDFKGEAELKSTEAFYLSGGLNLKWYFTSKLAANLGLTYNEYWSLFRGCGLQLGVGYTPEINLKRSSEIIGRSHGVDLSDVLFINVFPILYKFYENQPIGTAILYNNLNKSIKAVEVSIFIKRYMDSQMPVLVVEELEASESVQVQFKALFNEQILNVTEGTKVTADIFVEYIYSDESREEHYVHTVRVQNRNAIIWDDDLKVCAFVTSKDPVILKFAKNVVGWIDDERYEMVDKSLLKAIALHEALSQYGISYIIDPITPYTETSKQTEAIDYLQFPRQTLEYFGGDCDDLSVLYAALLEAVGVETAFITVPGHIYTAFALGQEADQLNKSYLKSEDLIRREGKIWIPVEVTATKKGFLQAWESGIKTWKKNEPQDHVNFFITRDSWRTYESVGFTEQPVELTLPHKEDVLLAYNRQVEQYVERELSPQVAKLQAEIESGGYYPALKNKIGVLYARFGLYSQAEEQFKEIIHSMEYLPALVNLGHLEFLSENMQQALLYYERAQRIEPDRPCVILALAKAYHELEDYAVVRKLYSKLKEVDLDLARRFSYLDMIGEEATRAAELTRDRWLTLWVEE